MPIKKCFVYGCRFCIMSFKEDAVTERKMEDHVIRVHVKELGVKILIQELGVDTLIPYAIDGFFSENDENELIERYLNLLAKQEEKRLKQNEAREDIKVEKDKSISKEDDKKEWKVYSMTNETRKVKEMSSIWGQSSVVYCFSGAKRKETIEIDKAVINRFDTLDEREKTSELKIVPSDKGGSKMIDVEQIEISIEDMVVNVEEDKQVDMKADIDKKDGDSERVKVTYSDFSDDFYEEPRQDDGKKDNVLDIVKRCQEAMMRKIVDKKENKEIKMAAEIEDSIMKEGCREDEEAHIKNPVNEITRLEEGNKMVEQMLFGNNDLSEDSVDINI